MTPNAQHGDVWMSGGAPAADANNDLYRVSGQRIPAFSFLEGIRRFPAASSNLTVRGEIIKRT
jgi:hypothetical protein